MKSTKNVCNKNCGHNNRSHQLITPPETIHTAELRQNNNQNHDLVQAQNVVELTIFYYHTSISSNPLVDKQFGKQG